MPDKDEHQDSDKGSPVIGNHFLIPLREKLNRILCIYSKRSLNPGVDSDSRWMYDPFTVHLT